DGARHGIFPLRGDFVTRFAATRRETPPRRRTIGGSKTRSASAEHNSCRVQCEENARALGSVGGSEEGERRTRTLLEHERVGHPEVLLQRDALLGGTAAESFGVVHLVEHHRR